MAVTLSPSDVVAGTPIVGVLLLWIASLFSEPVANFVYKLHLLRLGISHMLFSSDKRWKKLPDAAKVRNPKRSKKIVFVRHGESAWNVVFNKGPLVQLPVRLGSALVEEMGMLTTMNSVFFDSPLSQLGAEQGLSLRSFVEDTKENDELSRVLRGDPKAPKSVLVSSNLRRALSTAAIGFWDRLRRTQEAVKVLSCLQEITFNVDGVALAKPQTAPVLADVELNALGISDPARFQPDRYFECSENAGDKAIRSRGVDRLRAFAAWAMEREEEYVIAAGHSLYARFFFQTFLPDDSKHVSKFEKMENAAVVAFTLEEGIDANGDVAFAIREDTIDARHGGFETKKGYLAKLAALEKKAE